MIADGVHNIHGQGRKFEALGSSLKALMTTTRTDSKQLARAY